MGTAVLDAMASVDMVWCLCGVMDVPEERRLFSELEVMLAGTRKHVQHELEARRQVAALAAMAEVAGGDLRSRPRVSIVCCTASPLLAHGELLDASTDMALLGITAMLDMRQTTYSFGALETAVMAAVCVEVAHHLGVPCLAPALGTDAKHPGVQAAYEKALKGLTIASTRPDLMTGGIGQLQGAGLMSLPQVVIDDEIAQMIARILDGVEVSGETILSGMIERVGHRGDYLKEKDTRRRLRAGEVFQPAIADRQSWEHWRAAGTDEVETARAAVRGIVAAAGARGPLLTEAQLRELAACVDAGSQGSAPGGARRTAGR
jgi:trimethylamine:corrinoid methyltransferase-like protein